MDPLHIDLQAVIDLFGQPVQPLAVLHHFQSGHGDPAGIGGFTRSIKNLFILEDINCLRRAGHVGPLADEADIIVNQFIGVIFIDFILGRTRKRTIGPVAPQGVEFQGVIRLGVSRARVFLGICLNPAPLNIFQTFHIGQLFHMNALRVEHVT